MKNKAILAAGLILAVAATTACTEIYDFSSMPAVPVSGNTSFNGVISPEEIFDSGLNIDASLSGDTEGKTTTPFGNTFDEVGVVLEEETAIAVSFPFRESMKGYSLLYIKTDDRCFMRLFDAAGNNIQEFGDMHIEGVPYFRYDNLISGGDFQGFSVFDPEAGDDEYPGCYFVLNENSRKFDFDSVSIPAYDGILEGTYSILMYTEDKQETSGSRDFYQIYLEAGKCLKCKRWEYEVKDADYGQTFMKIYDTIGDELLYEGPMELDNDFEPINQDFYKSMLLNNLQIYQAGEIETSVVFYTGETEEGEDGELKSRTREYTDLEECLKDQGLDASYKVGEYVNEFGNVELEAYYNKEESQGAAVIYSWYYTPDIEKAAYMEVYPINTFVRSKNVRSFQPMPLTAEEKMSGYYKTTEYVSGRLRNLEIKDFDRTMEGPGYETLIQENYVYRDDGSLYYHGRSHNAYYFGIDYMAMNEKYDGSSRMCHSSAIVMTGSNEIYNLYDKESKKPQYQLFFDRSEAERVTRVEINEVK